jgi:peptidylprolyl isomerase
MRRFLPAFCLAAAVAVSAQTAPNPSTAPAQAHAKSSSTTGTKTGAGTSRSSAATSYKLPADEKRIPGIPKTAFALKYQEIKIGTGAEGESGKMWHVKYKGWRAADGVVFDNWEDHKRPVTDKDGKPEMGPDGKPKLGDPEPLVFPQGMGRLIPGFDYGISGMRIGGKRRLFIPWQMAYGTRSIPDRPDHPGIPAKSDLIFDVELVEVTDPPAPPQRPLIPPGGGTVRPQPSTPPQGSAPATGQPAAPDSSKPATPDSSKPATPATPPNPGSTPAPTQPTTPPPAPQQK